MLRFMAALSDASSARLRQYCVQVSRRGRERHQFVLVSGLIRRGRRRTVSPSARACSRDVLGDVTVPSCFAVGDDLGEVGVVEVGFAEVRASEVGSGQVRVP